MEPEKKPIKKYVYLFELDSVKNTDEEIVAGQKALYDEIVKNGNCVVLTYNQLVESRGFFNLLDNKSYFDSFCTLFQEGYLRLSQYKDFRTPVQYLINAFDYDKEFIFSGWPLKSTQKRLLALIRRCLMYNDLSELESYISDADREPEIKELFTEVSGGKLNPSTLSDEEQKSILKKLKSLLKTISSLSIEPAYFIPPKNPKEYYMLTLHNVIHTVLSLTCPADAETVDSSLWAEAVSIIGDIQSSIKNDATRSDYLHELKNKAANAKNKSAFSYAEAIIDLCYNYTCEISIYGVSKHYDIDELLDENDTVKKTFSDDFFRRWKDSKNESGFLQDKTNTFDKYVTDIIPSDFVRAARLCASSGYANGKTVNNKEQDVPKKEQNVPRYEYRFIEQQKDWKTALLSSLHKKILNLLLCVSIASTIGVLFEWLGDIIEDVLLSAMPSIRLFFTGLYRLLATFMPQELLRLIAAFLAAFILTLLALILTELITSFISKILPYKFTQPLSAALADILVAICDVFGVRMTSIKQPSDITDCNVVKEHNSASEIDYYLSPEMREYIELRKENPQDPFPIFQPSTTYPIADADTDKNLDTLKELNKYEELYNYRFGIIYASENHTFCSDPVINDNGNIPEHKDERFVAYERILPKKHNGVVMVTLYNGHFLLIEQYRHALRGTQICFPRGFPKPNKTELETAKEELEEELNAIVTKDPTLLGKVCSDSGLTGVFANVYLVSIDSYRIDHEKDKKTAKEGILSAVELSLDEIRQILAGHPVRGIEKIDDGFTLAALSLFTSKDICPEK